MKTGLAQLIRSHKDTAAVLLVAAAFLVCTGLFFGILQLDIDFGRDFETAGLMVQGRTLYRDVIYLFGPLAPWFHWLLFRLFGVSLRVLLRAGVAASFGIVLLTYVVARQILPPALSAAAALIVTVHAIYGPDTMSYATPYTFAATYGLLFALLTLYAACRALDAPAVSRWDFIAGAAAGLALPSKQDFAMISLGVLAAGLAIRLLRDPKRAAPSTAAAALPCALIVVFFAGVVLTHVSLAEFLASVYPKQAFVVWRRIYAYVGGWGPDAGERILETLFGLVLNFGFVLWAACLLALLAGLLRGERPAAGKRVWILLVVGLLFIRYGSYLGYYPLLLHFVVLGMAIAGRGPGPRLKAGFLAFCAALFLFRVPLYPRSELYGLMYFVPSLIVYIYLCRAVIVPYLARVLPEPRVRAALAIVFVFCFAVPEFVKKERHWAAPSERVWSERGVFRAEPDEAAKARVVLEEIRRYTSPGDRILVVPHGTTYYFLCDRQPASKYLNYAYGQVLDEAAEREEIRQWERTPPKLIIIDDAPQVLHFAGPVNTFGHAYDFQLGRWIGANYKEVRAMTYREREVHFLTPNAETGARQPQPSLR